MTETTRPSKQLVRDFMDRRADSDDPPPTRDEIRRQMGWGLVAPSRQPDRAERD
jgi:hypothetical protein